MLTDLLVRVRKKNSSRLLKIFTVDGLKKTSSLWREMKKRRAVEAEKARRIAEFKSEAWRHDAGFSQRTTLGTYKDHIARQASKMDALVKAGLARLNPTTIERFRRRFEAVPLSPNSSVLCLAARVGDEVEAWRQLGHPGAIGIDINPGPDNPLVLVGDFHDLQYPASSIDCVYCNSLDHAYDLDKIASEVNRVLKPGGIFVLDIVYGHSEHGAGKGYLVGPLDTTHWPTAKGFGEAMAMKCGFAMASTRDLKDVGSPEWVQCLLRKP